MESRDSWDCLYVWEGTSHEFYGFVCPSANSPTWWGWISWGGLMSMDVLLERYMKKLKGFVQQMTKPKGSMVEGYIVYYSI